MIIDDIFPIGIGKVRYDKHNKIKTKIASVAASVAMEENRYSLSLKHYNDAPKDFFTGDFIDFIERSALEYSKSIGYKFNEMCVVGIWLNECNAGGYQVPHDHGNSFISGTYYLNFDLSHSQLYFMNPMHSTYHSKPFMAHEPNDDSPYIKEKHTTRVKEGEALFWPSNLIHGYETNIENGRVTISFNLMPKDINYGSYRLVL